MSLKSKFEAVHAQVQAALEASQGLQDKNVARVLDDILLRQKFWAEDVGLEVDPYRCMSKEPSDAPSTMMLLSKFPLLLSDLQKVISTSRKR